VLSEKERLAARIAQLETRLSSMRRATRQKGSVRATKKTVQTYGDYVWKQEDVSDIVSFEVDYAQAESDYNNVLMGGDKTQFPSFKYALSPEERRRPSDMRATSWANSDGGNRVLQKLKTTVQSRKAGGIDSKTNKSFTQRVGVNSNAEISTFADWQVKVFEKNNSSNNNSMTKEELSENLKVWYNIHDEISPSKEHIDELTSLINLAVRKNVDVSVLSSSKNQLNQLLRDYNVIDTNYNSALTHLKKYMGIEGQFLQAKIGTIKNVMDNVVGFKNVRFYERNIEPSPSCSDVYKIDGKKVGGNYIKLNSKKYGSMVQPATDTVDATTHFFEEDYMQGRNHGPIINISSSKGNVFWLTYTVVSKDGNEIRVVEKFAKEEKTRGFTSAYQDLAFIEGTYEGGRPLASEEISQQTKKLITTQSKAIDDLMAGRSISISNWYKPQLQGLDFDEKHFEHKIPQGTDLTGANFENSNLTNVELIECNLAGCNFKGCVINNTNFKGCSFDENTIWPLGFGDITPDYFSVQPDGTSDTLTGDFRPWISFDNYIGSTGKHDPSGNSSDLNGAWGANQADVGARRWIDISGESIFKGYQTSLDDPDALPCYDLNGRIPGYIEASSFHRLSKGAYKEISEENKDYKSTDTGTQFIRSESTVELGLEEGVRIKGSSNNTGGSIIMACFGSPPRQLNKNKFGELSELNRGELSAADHSDVSRNYLLPGFFTLESACSWDGAAVTVSPLMKLLGKGNVEKVQNHMVFNTEYNDLELVLKQVGSQPVLVKNIITSFGRNEMATVKIFEQTEEGEQQNSFAGYLDGQTYPEQSTIMNATQLLALQNAVLFVSERIEVEPLTNASTQMLSVVPCPVDHIKTEGFEPLAGLLPSEVPYNVIFGHNVKDIDFSIARSVRTGDEVIPEINYMAPYDAITGSKYGSEKTNDAGKQSILAVQEYLEVAEFPTFSHAGEEPAENAVKNMFVSFNTIKPVDIDGNPESYSHQDSDGNNIGINRFAQFPIVNMALANFKKAKFGYLEYNHNRPDSYFIDGAQQTSTVVNQQQTENGDHGKRSKYFATCFKDMNLQKAIFEEADLRKCIFINCELQGANFKKADIRGCSFINCSYDGATSFEAVIGNDMCISDIDNHREAEKNLFVRGEDTVRFMNPLQGWDGDESVLVDDENDGTLTDLSANFKDANLIGVEFTGVCMGGNHTGANMSISVFYDTKVLGKSRSCNGGGHGWELNEFNYKYSLHQKSNAEKIILSDSATYNNLVEEDERATNLLALVEVLESELIDPEVAAAALNLLKVEQLKIQNMEDTLIRGGMKVVDARIEIKRRGLRYGDDASVVVGDDLVPLELPYVILTSMEPLDKTFEQLGLEMQMVKNKLSFPLGKRQIDVQTEPTSEPTALDRAKAGDKMLQNSCFAVSEAERFLKMQDFKELDLTNACLDGSDFSGCVMQNLILDGAQAVDCSFNNTLMYGLSAKNTKFNRSYFAGADISYSHWEKHPQHQADAGDDNDFVYFKHPTLNDVSIENGGREVATLAGADFGGADLNGANIVNMNVSNVNFSATPVLDDRRLDLVNKDGVAYAFPKNRIPGTNIFDTVFWGLKICDGVDEAFVNPTTAQITERLEYQHEYVVDLSGSNQQTDQADVERYNNCAPQFPYGFAYDVGTYPSLKDPAKEDRSYNARYGPTLFEKMKGLYNYDENSSGLESQGTLFLMNVENLQVDNCNLKTQQENPKVFNYYDTFARYLEIEKSSSLSYRTIANQKVFWQKRRDANGLFVDDNFNELTDYVSLNCINTDISHVKFDRCIMPRANFTDASANILNSARTTTLVAGDRNWEEARGEATLRNTKITSFVNIQSWLRPSETMGPNTSLELSVADGVLKQKMQDILRSNVRANMAEMVPDLADGVDTTSEVFLRSVSINFQNCDFAGYVDSGATDGARVFFSGSYIPYTNFKNAKLDHAVFGQSGNPNIGSYAALVADGFRQNVDNNGQLYGLTDATTLFIDNRTMLTGSDFTDASMKKVDMFNATIDHCIFKNVDLSQNLQGLSHLYSADYVSFENADLSNVRFGKNDFKEGYLSMKGVDFSGANLYDCEFNDIDFGNNLEVAGDTDLWIAETHFGTEENKLSLKNVKFNGCHVEKVDIRWALFDNTYFKNYQFNLSSQSSATDPRYGIYWPIGYYAKTGNAGDYATLHNIPPLSHIEGGFKNGYLSKPLAEAMLAAGVFNMNITKERVIVGDGPNFMTNTGSTQSRMIDDSSLSRSKKRIANLNLDYQSPANFLYVDENPEGVKKQAKQWLDNEGNKYFVWTDALLEKEGINDREEFTMVDWDTDRELFAMKMRLFNKTDMRSEQYPLVSKHWADKVRPDSDDDRILPSFDAPEAIYNKNAQEGMRGYGEQKYGYVTHRKPRYNDDGPVVRQKIDCTYSQMTASNPSDLSGIVFENCNIFGVNFSYSDMRHIEFVNCHFYECEFINCNMGNVKIDGSQFDTCSFRGVNMKTIIEQGAVGHAERESSMIKNTNFLDCDFTQADLTLVHLKTVNLSNVCFDLTNFTDANLENVAVLKVPIADTFYDPQVQVLGSDGAELITIHSLTSSTDYLPRRLLYNNLKQALEGKSEILNADNNEVLLAPGEFGSIVQNTGEYAVVTTSINSNGQAPDLNFDLNDMNATFASYNERKAQIKKKEVYYELINEISKAAQEEEKRFLWRPSLDNNNLPVRTDVVVPWIHKTAEDFEDLPANEQITSSEYSTTLNIGSAHIQYDDDVIDATIKAAMEADITGIRGGSWHADFRNAIFKNTIFNQFSVDGTTEDLHGVCYKCLPLGFLDKLWNNKLDSEGNYYTMDCSGNMEKLFLYAHLADPAAGINGNNEYMLDSGRPDSLLRLPRCESKFGLYELSGVLVKQNSTTTTAFYSDPSTKTPTVAGGPDGGSYGVKVDRYIEQVDNRKTGVGKTKYHAYAINTASIGQGWFAKSTASAKMTTNPTSGQQSLIYNLLAGKIDTDQDGTSDGIGDGSVGGANAFGYIAGTHDNQTNVTRGGVYSLGVRRTNNCGFDEFNEGATSGREPYGNDLWGNDDRGGKRLDGPTFRERLIARLGKYKGKADIGRKITLAGVSRENKNISQVGKPTGSTPWNRIDLKNVILSEANLGSGSDATKYFNHPEFNWGVGKVVENANNYTIVGNGENTSIITRLRKGDASKELLDVCYAAEDDNVLVDGTRVRGQVLSNELYIEGRYTHTDTTGTYTVGENGLQLVFADLTGANLAGANLTNANLEGALLNNTILHKTNLTGVNLKGADLRGAKLIDCDLTKAIIGYSEMTGEYTKFSDKVDHYIESTFEQFNNSTDTTTELVNGVFSQLEGIDGEQTIQNALPGRKILNESVIEKVSLSGSNGFQIVMNNNSLVDGSDMFPYGFNSPYITNVKIGTTLANPSGGSSTNDITGCEGSDEIIVYYKNNKLLLNPGTSIGKPESTNPLAFKPMSVNVDVLKSGIPLMGGKDYTKSFIINDISYTEIATTNSIFFNSLKRHGLNNKGFGPGTGNANNIGANMGTDLYMTGNDQIRKPGNFTDKIDRGINYDTIWHLSPGRGNENGFYNHSDYRSLYIMTTGTIGGASISVYDEIRTTINFPPTNIWEETVGDEIHTKGGNYAYYHPNNSNVEDADREEYNALHHQPRFDFSTPDILKRDDSEIRTKFAGCDLSLCIFPYSNFINSDCEGTKFNGALLRGCDFSGANLKNVDFGSCYANSGNSTEPETTGFPVNQNIVNDQTIKGGVRTDLVKTNFRNANCEGVNFNTANLAYADFSGADISGATFWGANIAHADFRHAKIGDLYLGDISDAAITGHGVNFIGAGPWYTVQPGIEQCNGVDENNQLTSTRLGNKFYLSENGYDTNSPYKPSTKITQEMVYKEFWTLADETLFLDGEYSYGKDSTNYSMIDGTLSLKDTVIDSDNTTKLKKLVYYNDDTHPYWGNANIFNSNPNSVIADVLDNGAASSTGRLAFKFYYEAISQPYSKLYNEDLMNVDLAPVEGENTQVKELIRAHGDNILMKVMPKFPRGFNTAAALGWQRDVSGVVIPHFRKGALFFSNGSEDQQSQSKPMLAKPVINSILANAALKTEGPDPNNTNGFIDISNSLYVNGALRNYKDVAISAIPQNANPLEHGYGLGNTNKELYLKTQTSIACNYYDTFSSPVKGTDLSGMVFVKSDRSVAAIFEGVDFTKPGAHADVGMKFVNSDMFGVDFSGCLFPHDLEAIDTVDPMPTHATLFENCDLSGASFKYATLKNAKIDVSCIIHDVRFDGADLTGTDFTGLDLSNVYFSNVGESQKGLTAKEVRDGVVINANIQDCYFENVKNPHLAKWPLGTDISGICGINDDGTRYTPSRTSDSGLDQIELYEELAAGRRNFIGRTFVKADFENLNAEGNNTIPLLSFQECCLQDCVFSSGNTLTDGEYNGLSLNGVDFSGCDLTRTVFTGVDLTGAIFTNHTLFNQTVFVGALYPEAAHEWPQGFNYDIAVVDNDAQYNTSTAAQGSFLNWIYHSGADWEVMKASQTSNPDLYSYWMNVEGCREWHSLWHQGLQGLEDSDPNTTLADSSGVDISSALIGRFTAADFGVDLTLQGRFSRHDMSSNNPTNLEKALGYPRVVADATGKNIFENVGLYQNGGMSTTQVSAVNNLIVKTSAESYSGNEVLDASQNKQMFLGANMAYIDMSEEVFNSKDLSWANYQGIQKIVVSGAKQHLANTAVVDKIGLATLAWNGTKFVGTNTGTTFSVEYQTSDANDTEFSDVSGSWLLKNDTSNKLLYFKPTGSPEVNKLMDNTLEWCTVRAPSSANVELTAIVGSRQPTKVSNVSQYANRHVFDFKGAYVSGANFKNADLSGVVFTNCQIDNNLAANSLTFADLTGCNFTGSDLTNADFSGCDLENCVFTYAKIKNTNFGWTNNTAKARFPGGFDFLYQTPADGSKRSTYDYTDQTVSIREFLGSMRGWMSGVSDIHIGINDDDGTADGNNTSDPVDQDNRLYTINMNNPETFLQANYYPITTYVNDDYQQAWEYHNVDADRGKVWIAESEVANLIPNTGKQVDSTRLINNAGPNRQVYVSTDDQETYDFAKNRWEGLGGGYNFDSLNTLFTFNGVELSPTVEFQGTVKGTAMLNSVVGEISLVNINLQNSNLQNGSFKSSNIRGMNLSGADISGLDLSGACLSIDIDSGTNVNITGALMSIPQTGTIGADLSGNTPQTQFRSVLRTHVPNEFSKHFNNTDGRLESGLNGLIAEDVRFSNDTTRANTAYSFEECSLHGASFNNSILAHVSFKNANLENATFIGCDLSSADFTEANIRGADFRGADISGTNFTHAFWSDTTKMPSGLVSIDQDMINITSGNVKDCTYAGKNSASTTDNGAPKFDGSDDVGFSYCISAVVKRIKSGRKAPKQEIIKILCNETNCSNDFKSNQGADLEFWNNGKNYWDIGGNTKNTSTDNTNAADLSNVQVLFQNPEIFPLTTSETGARSTTKTGTNMIIATQLDLSGANLKNADMKNSKFNKANLSHAILDNVDISATDFTGADMFGATLKNTVINQYQLGNVASASQGLDGYSYFSTHMENTTIEDMDFSGVVFDNYTDFSGSTITDVSFNNAILVNACFNHSTITSSTTNIAAQTYTSFSDADTHGVSFVGATIKHVDISGMHCGDIDFSGATIEDLSFSRIEDYNLGYSIFDNAHVKKCDISGIDDNNPMHWNGSAKSTHFEECKFDLFDIHNCAMMDFSGARFTTCSFKRCDLKEGKFVNVDFASQDLSDCSLNKVSFNGADLTNTIINDVSTNKWRNGPLVDVDISNATLDYTQMVNIESIKLYTSESIPLNGSCFDGLDMSGTDFTESGGFQGSTWNNCKLTNIGLSGCELSGNEFTNATIVMKDFASAADAQAHHITNAHVKSDPRFKYKSDFKNAIKRAFGEYLTAEGAINFEGSTIPNDLFSGVDISCVKSLKKLNVAGLDLQNSSVGPRVENMRTSHGLTMDMTEAKLQNMLSDVQSKLNYIDFTQSDLTGAVIAGECAHSIFDRTILLNSYIQGVDISHSTFTDISFNGSFLIGTDMSTCILENVDFTNTDLSGVAMPPTYNVFSFAGANMGGSASDTHAHAKLDLSHNTTTLINKSFLDASMNNVDFSGSDLTGVIFTQNDTPTNADGVARRALVKQALTDISLVSLNNSILHKMDFGWHNNASNKMNFHQLGMGNELVNVDFSGSDLSGAVFDGLTITECNFNSCDLSGSSFKNCIMTKNCWEGANITGMDISTATLNYEILGGGCFEHDQLISGSYVLGTIWPKEYENKWHEGGWVPTSGAHMVKGLKYATLNNVSFSYVGMWSGLGQHIPADEGELQSLGDIKWHNAHFAGAQLKVDFSGAELKNADFRSSDLSGSSFVLANLTGSNFEDADLSGVDFSGANLTGCNLNGVDLSGVNMNNTTISETSFFQAKNTIHIDFSGVDLHRYYDTPNGSLHVGDGEMTKFITPNHIYEFPDRASTSLCIDISGFRQHTVNQNGTTTKISDPGADSRNIMPYTVDVNVAYDVSQNKYAINTVGMMGCDGEPEMDHPDINENIEYPKPRNNQKTPFEKNGWQY
jgi:uncharacterized protein YjbI with pentapeptide repeats